MKMTFKIIIALLGVLFLISTITSGFGSGRTGVSFILGIALAGCLIFSPFTGLSYLLGYLFMVIVIIGSIIIGMVLGAKILGVLGEFMSTIGMLVGALGGFAVGMKVSESKMYNSIFDSIASLSKHDN